LSVVIAPDNRSDKLLSTVETVFVRCVSGMLWTSRSRRATMKWLVRRRSFTCSCTQAGVHGTTTDFTRKRNGNYAVINSDTQW